MKIVKCTKISPIIATAGDSIELNYISLDGKKHRLLRETIIEDKITFDEAMIFKVEPTDIDGAVGGYGGAFLTPAKRR